MTFSTTFSTISRDRRHSSDGSLGRRRFRLRFLLRHRQRLGDLAVVAVDGDGLHAHLPGVDVELLDLLHRRLLGHVDRLGQSARDERLDRRHHPHVARVVDGVVAHRAGEDRQVLTSQVWCADDRLVLVEVGDDLVDLTRVVAEAAQRPRNRLVDDRHRAAADERLDLHEPEVGLDAGGVAVHHQADRASGSDHAGLAVAHTCLGSEVTRLVPCLLRGGQQLGRHQLLVDVRRRLLVHLQDAQHVLAVVLVAGEGAHASGRAGRRVVGVTGHERGDGRGVGAALVAVVRKSQCHQRGTEVGVAEAELTEPAGCLADGRSRVVGPPHEDLLAREHHLYRVAEALDVEAVGGAVVGEVEELEQVEAGQVARRVVEVHVLAAVRHNHAVHDI